MQYHTAASGDHTPFVSAEADPDGQHPIRQHIPVECVVRQRQPQRRLPIWLWIHLRVDTGPRSPGVRTAIHRPDLFRPVGRPPVPVIPSVLSEVAITLRGDQPPRNAGVISFPLSLLMFLFFPAPPLLKRLNYFHCQPQSLPNFSPLSCRLPSARPFSFP